MKTSINFELILVMITLIAAAIILFHFLFRLGKPKQARRDNPVLVDYAKSFFPIFLFVIVLRSFVAEPFRIPSGSMIPTLTIGDFVLVKKYVYGLRLPVIHKKIMDVGKPKRGDIVVFRYPPNPSVNYIKRLVGLPGDEIEWTANKKLIINGNPVPYQLDAPYEMNDRGGKRISVTQLSETLPDDESHKLIVLQNRTRPGKWRVPAGHYFMMGDNRDNSSDSRFWGFVPEENLVGKASLVWLHWNLQSNGDGFQTDRIGTTLD